MRLLAPWCRLSLPPGRSSLATTAFLAFFLLALAACDVIGQIAGNDVVAQTARDNPLDPAVKRTQVIRLGSPSGGVVDTQWPKVQVSFGSPTESYQLQIADHSDFGGTLTVDETALTETSHRITKPLTNNTVYFWRLRIHYATGQTGPWTVAESFRVVVSGPTATSPSTALTSLPGQFSWSSVTGKTQYRFQLTDRTDWVNPLIDLATSARSMATPSMCQMAVDYRWRVRAEYEEGSVSDWSEAAFSARLAVPTISPLPGGVASSLTPTLSWQASKWYETWDVEIDIDPLFSQASVFRVSNASYLISSPLHLRTQYYARARAVSGGSVGEWGPVMSFWSPRVSFGKGTKIGGAAAANPKLSALGDLNGDGRVDVVTSSGGLVYLSTQNPDGTFALWTQLSGYGGVKGLLVQDVNQDGWADLVVSQDPTTLGQSKGLAIGLQSLASHSLSAPSYLATSSAFLGSLCGGDFNSDGLPDVAVLGASVDSYTGGDTRIGLYYQMAGGLADEVVYTNPLLQKVDAWLGDREIHAADLGNGRSDLVLHAGGTKLAVVRQIAKGVFSTTPTVLDVPVDYWGRFYSFALGDLDDDGLTDIVAANFVYGACQILFQQQDGTWAPPVVQSMQSGVQVTTADIDGDGDLDLITSSGYGASIAFQAPGRQWVGPAGLSFDTNSMGGSFDHQALSVGDVNGDGRPDLVQAWWGGGVYVKLQL